MADLSLEIQVGLAEVLGFTALGASLLIWRGSEFRNLFRQIVLYTSFIETGLAPQWLYKDRYKLLLQGALQLLGIVGCLAFFWNTYHYLYLVQLLVAHSDAVDLGLFERLQAHTEDEKTNLVLLGFLTSLIFAIDYVVALVLTSGVKNIEEKDVPSDSHLYIVPDQWRRAFSAMWESRIKRASARFQDSAEKHELDGALKNRKWQTDWAVWARCVADYQATTSS